MSLFQKYTIEPHFKDIIKLVKEFIISDHVSHLSYNLVPGLQSYLNDSNNGLLKEYNNCDKIELNYKDNALNLSRSIESDSFSPFSASSSYESSPYHTKTSLPKYSLSESCESFHNTTLSEENTTQVLKSSSQLTVENECVESQTKETEHSSHYQYYVDENMDEEAVLKHILGIHQAEISDNITYTIQTAKSKVENEVESVEVNKTKKIENIPNFEMAAYNYDESFENKKNYSFYKEFKNVTQQNDYEPQVTHRSRSMASNKTRGYYQEFKKSLDRDLNRSNSRNKVSFSRNSIHEEFKRSRGRLNSIEKSSSNERSNSYSRSNFKQEFKRNRNRNKYEVEQEAEDTSNTRNTNSIVNRKLSNEFKRSKSRVNSRRYESQGLENQDTDIDESKNSLNLYESINEIDIRNRKIENYQNQRYTQEFKKSPINFPRVEDEQQPMRRVNKSGQVSHERYGFDETQHPYHAYSTQSLPSIDKDEDNHLKEEEITKQTLSLDEKGEKKVFQGSLLNRTLLKQIKAKNGSNEPKIDLKLLDKNELESLQHMFDIKKVISSEIELEIKRGKEETDVKTSKQKRKLLVQVLQELKEECKKQKNKNSKFKRDDLWKKLNVCLENDAVYVVNNNIAMRSVSPNEADNDSDEDRLLEKLLDLMKPLIRQIVREEVKKCISELLK